MRMYRASWGAQMPSKKLTRQNKRKNWLMVYPRQTKTLPSSKRTVQKERRKMRRTFNPSSKIIMINRTRSKAILLSGRGPEMPLKNMSKRRLKSLKKMKEAKMALIKIMLTD